LDARNSLREKGYNLIMETLPTRYDNISVPRIISDDAVIQIFLPLSARYLSFGPASLQYCTSSSTVTSYPSMYCFSNFFISSSKSALASGSSKNTYDEW